MKTLRILLALSLVSLALSGCQSRNDNSSSTPAASQPPVVSTIPDIVSEAEDGIEDLVSGFEDGMSDLVDDIEDGLDMSRDDETTVSDLEDESAAAAMSTDFAEIGALSAEKLGWGSGGPTDNSGRPNGCTAYQEKYGKYDAYFIAPSNNKIYLTFDEGYENGYTPAILDTLKEREVKAVFFVTLDFCQRQPELVTRMIEEGHVLGNHSCKHLSFPDMPLEEAAKDIMQLHDYVKSNFGYEMYLFRPPMGEFSEQSLALAQSLGYKSIFWSFAYKDYDVDNQPLTIEALDSVSNKSHPGAIYLLHAVSKTNSDILGEAIDNLQQQGYTLAKWDIY